MYNKSLLMKSGTKITPLFLSSFLSLFLEMFLIRWNPACAKLIGYYTNLILIACFLGLGAGMASAKKISRFPLEFSFLFLILNGFLLLLVQMGIKPVQMSQDWGERIFWSGAQSGAIPVWLVIPFVFVLNAVVMFPLGKEIGRWFEDSAPLRQYLINLVASLLGVVSFALLNHLYPSPLLFAGTGLLIYLVYLRIALASGKRVLSAGIFSLLSLSLIFWAKADTIWSPYYKIKITHWYLPKPLPDGQSHLGFVMDINDDYHQFAFNASPEFLDQLRTAHPSAYRTIASFSNLTALPYQLVNQPDKILILGAGTGNDVASALASSASRIDAVEIDPIIARLGIRFHPEKPYQDSRVRLIINDARNFLKTSKEKYALIVYALLDSHTLFSSLASVRLENFVYTQEGLQAAEKRLSPDGVLVVIFNTRRNFVSKRIFWLVNQSFPEKTRSFVFKDPQHPMKDYEIMIASRAPLHLPPSIEADLMETTDDYAQTPPDRLPSDDWPFLYLEKTGLETSYAQTLILLICLSLLFLKASLKNFRAIDPHFFFLGAAFLFLETKAITQLSILFGSTWTVSNLVVACFLIMAILSTIFSSYLAPKTRIRIYLPLVLILILNFFFPWNKLLGFREISQILLGGTLMSLPAFFSGLIFALSLKISKDPASALGSNLLGATIGGFCEYLTMLWGFQILWLFAIGFYLIAGIFQNRK